MPLYTTDALILRTYKLGESDRIVVFLAPKLLGGERSLGVLGGEGFARIGDALSVRITEVTPVGEDLMVEADVHRDR